MAARVTGYVHLPGVTLAPDGDGDGAAVGPGRVVVLPFDWWLRLDRRFAYVEKKYRESAPAFWVCELPSGHRDDDDAPGAVDALFEVRHVVHTAFLLEPRVPLLPSPALSTGYVTVAKASDPHDPAAATRVLVAGPAEAEWIIFGFPLSVPYGRADLARVDREFGLLEGMQGEAAFDGVRAGLAALERTARPESWWGGDGLLHRVNDFIHCVIACEGILLPGRGEGGGGDDSLTDTFGRNAAALLEANFAGVGALAKALSEVYRLRSRLVHGRLGLRDLDEARRALLPSGRALLRDVLRAAIAVRPGAASDDALPTMLAAAAADGAAHATLHAGLERLR